MVLEQISLRISKESKEKLELLAKSTGRSKNFKPVCMCSHELTCFKNGYIFI